jgi:hypothetical protein
MAYVGKGKNGLISFPARIQVTEPGRGAHLSNSGKKVFQETGAFYLVDNPSYNYYWVDSNSDMSHPNAVTFRAGGANSLSASFGRIQVDGQMNIAFAWTTLGLTLFGSDGVEQVAKSYQILVCDPKPVNLCSKFCF